MKTVIVWFRNDLRIHDHPALAAAVQQADTVVPLFIFNDDLLQGRHGSANRNRFLLESLQDLKSSLAAKGGDLIVRQGKPDILLPQLTKELSADAVFYTADFTPYAIRRDKNIKQLLAKENIDFHSYGGRLIVDQLDKLQTKSGTTHKVFTPFWKNWQQLQRRPLAKLPAKITLPSGIETGSLPKLNDIVHETDLSADVLPGGESAGRKRMQAWISKGVDQYHQTNNNLGEDGTSRLSPYLHFGCISALELESMLHTKISSHGASAFNRQLAWRDFYHYIIYKFPDNRRHEFQERYRNMDWHSDEKLLTAWQQGKTGFPVVDAAMRALNHDGWMHNRARLIVGSFLTKDLGLDWREGEAYFMRMLVDGDEANNNGNWQWIASVGVDPAPVYRRLYNPTTQGKRFDPDGDYIRRYVPELAKLPTKFVHEPWLMSEADQTAAGCIIGKDYPAQIVDHAEARLVALEKYRIN